LLIAFFQSLNKILYVRSAASGSKRSTDGDQDDSNKVCFSINFYKNVVDECNVLFFPLLCVEVGTLRK